MPIWLNEGTAVYLGPHDLYSNACENAFPYKLFPTLQQLENTYGDIQAADLFAYTAVDFIVHEYGFTKLNDLVRSTDSVETILKVTPTEFEVEWRQYVKIHCHENES
jgi:hypothetical protein